MPKWNAKVRFNLIILLEVVQVYKLRHIAPPFLNALLSLVTETATSSASTWLAIINAIFRRQWHWCQFKTLPSYILIYHKILVMWHGRNQQKIMKLYAKHLRVGFPTTNMITITFSSWQRSLALGENWRC